ncbi:FUSC family protein [Salinisphaera sp. USBA-960]|uniref:FUSC family protein n=1 Tax=Salinisphaera orenii TaxID=856731 RepID=UPI000DBE1FB9|nr:FUSC family protein [Salifodinibacter halophilus]NNC26042.1 FUSC family protein [Salifodinibacter halophilus]
MQRLAWLYAPSTDAILFALRLCVAMALTLYLAMWLQLDRPYWAALEVAAMMQPIPGMAVARGFARTIGTIIAGCVGLLLVALFAQSLVLSGAALALWVSFCSFFASLSRNNLIFGFAIAGFLTGLTLVLSHTLPQSPFEIALARTSECVLAALVASAVNVLLTPPVSARGYIQGRVRLLQSLGAEVLGVGRRAAGQTGEEDGRTNTASADADQENDPHVSLDALARQALALEQTRRYAIYESPGFERANRLARHLDYELLALISAISSLRIYIANRIGKINVDVLVELDEPAAIMRDHPEDPVRIRQALNKAHARILAYTQAPADDEQERRLADWVVLSRSLDLTNRLRAAVIKHEMLIHDRRSTSNEAEAIQARFSQALDVKHAFRNALRTLVAVSLGATIWVNFHDQLSAVLLVILLSALTTILATVPSPVAAAGFFGRGAAIAAVAAFGVDFLLLPQASGFVMLMLCLLPMVFASGLAMAKPDPKIAVSGRISLIMFALLTHVQNGAIPPFTTYVEILIGITMAITLTMLSFKLIMPVSPNQRLREQLAGVFNEMTRDHKQHSRVRFETRMYDRLSQLSMNAAVNPTHFSARQAVMATLNMGLEIRSLRVYAERAGFTQSIDRSIDAMVEQIGIFFAQQSRTLGAINALQNQAHDLAQQMSQSAVLVESPARRRLAIRAAVSAELVASAVADYGVAFEASQSAKLDPVGAV